MSMSIIKHSDFYEDLRLDAEYYKEEYLDVERKLEQNKNCILLCKIAKKSKKRFNPLTNPNDEFSYIEIDNIDLSNGRFDYSKLKNYQAPSRARKLLDYQDILISTVRPNRNAISIFLERSSNFVCSTGFAVIKAHKINPYYLFAFLKTKYAVKQLIRKTAAAMYPAISEDDIMTLRIVVPEKSFQNKIESKIKSAYEKEEYADKKYQKAENTLLTELRGKGFKIPDKKTNIITYSDYKKTFRLDARFYLPKYGAALEIINNSGFEINTIAEVIKEPLKSGATPLAGTNAYIVKEKGIPFFRIVNIKNYELSQDNLLYIRPDIHNSSLNRSKLKPRDVLFSIAGTIGICTVVPESIKEGNINQALAIIRLKNDFDPFFVALYFNSTIGKLISEKISRPVVQSNLNLSELATLPIPKIPKPAQDKISKLFVESSNLHKEAKNLVTEAIHEVEKIILEDTV